MPDIQDYEINMSEKEREDVKLWKFNKALSDLQKDIEKRGGKLISFGVVKEDK